MIQPAGPRHLPPESSALALSNRNFDALSAQQRASWTSAFLHARKPDNTPWPERLIIELANTCNLDCPMCRVGASGLDLSRVMSLESFRQLASTLFPHVRDVRLNGLGESTAIPNFSDYLDELEAWPIQVELITNGTGSVELYKRMVGRGARLLFSWDAATPALFEALRRPARWFPLLETVTAVSRQANALGQQKQLYLLYTLQSANVHELPALVEKAAEWGIPNLVVNVAKLATDRWLERHLSEIQEVFIAADARARETQVRLYLPDRVAGEPVTLASASPTAGTCCDRPWKEAVIRWDLDVQVCNMFNPYTYGNLQLHRFEQVWRGGFAQTFRAQINTPGRHPYCKGCHYMGEVYDGSQR